ncbi:MAG TPA: hypothetical protein VIJ66_09440 [Solirubrobacteraceae bacterium]
MWSCVHSPRGSSPQPKNLTYAGERYDYRESQGRSISYLAVPYIVGAIGWRRTRDLDGILTDVIADAQTAVV